MPFDLLSHDVDVFLFVLVRMSSFFFITPFFGYRNIPVQIKAGFCLLLTILVTPVVAASQSGAATMGLPLGALVLVVLKEFMVGITLGLVAAFIFSAIQIGGMFIDVQVGFSMASVFDPMTGASNPLTGQFKYLLAMLLFLGFNGHHELLTALLQSYTFFPVGGFHLSDNLLSLLMQTFSTMFLLGVKLAIPVVAALFLTDVGLALLSRAVPQMNVFVLGMPIKLIVGILMLIVVMPSVVYLLRELFQTMFTQMDSLLRVMGG